MLTCDVTLRWFLLKDKLLHTLLHTWAHKHPRLPIVSVIDKAESAFQSRVTQKAIFLVFTKEKERLVREWLSSLLYHLYSGKYWEGGKKRFPSVRQRAQFHLWDISFIGNWLWMVENFENFHPSRFLIQHFFIWCSLCVLGEGVRCTFWAFFVIASSDVDCLWCSDESKTAPYIPLPPTSFILLCFILFYYYFIQLFKHLLVKVKAPLFPCPRSGWTTGAITGYTLLSTVRVFISIFFLHFVSFLYTSFTRLLHMPTARFQSARVLREKTFHFHAIIWTITRSCSYAGSIWCQKVSIIYLSCSKL